MSVTSTLERASVESTASAVSWASIVAGALAAVGLSIALMFVGAGLGLTAVSPWSGAGATATTFVVSAAIWFLVVQWLSSAVGGYIAGRLRTQWSSVHGDEVYFRDTAHGFLSWAFSTVIVICLAASAAGSLVSGGASAVATSVGAATKGAAQVATNAIAPTDYVTDVLFRTGPTGAVAAQPSAQAPTIADNKAEAGRLLANAVVDGRLADPDKAYLARMIAGSTGIAEADAQKRIDEVLAQMDAAKVKAREVADAARKASLTTAFMAALAMFIGAFIASAAAALGGVRRDEYDRAFRSRA